jgi:hypothetical protein
MQMTGIGAIVTGGASGLGDRFHNRPVKLFDRCFAAQAGIYRMILSRNHLHVLDPATLRFPAALPGPRIIDHVAPGVSMSQTRTVRAAPLVPQLRTPIQASDAANSTDRSTVG